MIRQVCVIGAGVIGLSTALRLLETLDDVRVTVIAGDLTPRTASDGAGGFWQPYLLGDNSEDDIRRWGQDTFQFLLELSRTELADTAGVYLVSGDELYHSTVPDPFWSDIVIGFKHLTPAELQRYPEARFGYTYTTVTCEGRKYLPWLMTRIKDKGGRIVQRKIRSFEELYPKYDVIVNCTGLGSRQLCDDLELQPIKGQLIKVEAPWIKRFVVIDDEEIYILVNSNAVILGGTNEVGESTLNVNQTERERIWSRCCQIIPSLKHSRHISDWVGLRPSRRTVRLELQTVKYGESIKQIIHNYGHGGAGVTLHWGCANQAVSLVREAMTRMPPERH